jgi:L-rhamnose mutarotase
MIPEYRRRHEEVWPEMLEALSRTGWHNYTLFIRSDGTLFGYFESPDSFAAALDGMSREEINSRWQAEMSPFFDAEGGAADTMMEELVEVFHLD